MTVTVFLILTVLYEGFDFLGSDHKTLSVLKCRRCAVCVFHPSTLLPQQLAVGWAAAERSWLLSLWGQYVTSC